MNKRANNDLHHLPFAEYARLTAERGAHQFGGSGAPKLSFEELVASDMTFDQVAAEYGEETAINVIIARDPDAPEWTPEDFAQARPTAEVLPHILERWQQAKSRPAEDAKPRVRGKQKAPTKEAVHIRLDPDLLAHFRASGPGWQTRLNATLRQAVFGPKDPSITPP